MSRNHFALILNLFALLVSYHSEVFAQDKTATSDESSWVKDSWENIKSPVTTKARYSLFTGAGITAALLIFEDQIIDPVQNETVEDKPLGGFSRVGDISGQMVPNALYVFGMLGYGYLASSSLAKSNASAMFQATLYSGLIATALKYTVREPRPNDGNDKKSFPSGHSTTAFAFASYVGCRHSLPWGIAAYSLATLVGYSRMNDNKHNIHDVVAGATIGESYGLGICLAENQRNEDAQSQSLHHVSWHVSPIARGAAGVMTLSY